MTPRHAPRLVFRIIFFSFLYFILLIPFNSSRAADALPDTGQTKCYNATDQIPCPASGALFYGQDGNYEGLPPTYQVSADSLVVTDLNTGLMWQRADDGVERSWVAASAYCETLSLSRYDDWYLPSRIELVSIVDYGRTSPAVNPVFTSLNQIYWSASHFALESDKAWCVYFSSGVTSNLGKEQTHYVRCVRSGP
jgi:hypothetical protein